MFLMLCFEDNLENEDLKEERMEERNEVVEKNEEDVVRTKYENISEETSLASCS